jgi:AmmeMemoRadiSam system protein B
MNKEQPKLRSHLEAIPIRRSGEVYIVLRDLEGVNPEPLVISTLAYFIVTQMDGSNSIVDIQASYMRRFGNFLYREDLDELIEKLDTYMFLDNENSRNRLQEMITEFCELPSRPGYHVGAAYEADPERLRTQLLSFFLAENGGPGEPQPSESGRRILGLIAPHIDLRAGGPCFAFAYKALLEASPIKTCVILGTGHEPLTHHFALSRKDFDTPLGPVAADKDFIEALSSSCTIDLFADEFAHRREHTIEFQTLFLKLLMPQVRIVPLLCSFGVEEIERQEDTLVSMVQALKETFDGYGQPVCLLASVDLAHIGPRYGDPFHPHAGTVREHQDADRHLCQTMATVDAEAFSDVLMRERNSRRICGLPPLYVLLKTLQGNAEGSLLHYDHTEVDSDHSFVTFASMAFYELNS